MVLLRQTQVHYETDKRKYFAANDKHLDIAEAAYHGTIRDFQRENRVLLIQTCKEVMVENLCGYTNACAKNHKCYNNSNSLEKTDGMVH